MSKKHKQQVSHLHRQVVGLVTYLAVLAVVLGLASTLLVRAFRPPELAPLAGHVIDVAANMGGFDKPEIRIKAGEPVNCASPARIISITPTAAASTNGPWMS